MASLIGAGRALSITDDTAGDRHAFVPAGFGRQLTEATSSAPIIGIIASPESVAVALAAI
ncbi:hypothetical protein [Pseudarthrobacter sp. NKDBFgelt]|uniref:hypothetical protein n=1 Tax=Pseudarthrobacter sp. NKDBFgelt TaxID=3384443 RepID=UPI0038D3C536